MDTRLLTPLFFLICCTILFSCAKNLDESLAVTTFPVTEILYDPVSDMSEAVVRGEVSGDVNSVYEKGFIWSKGNKFDFNKVPVNLDGEFSYVMGELEKNVKYYVSAYVLSAVGTVYGETLCFTASTVPSFDMAEDNAEYVTDITGTTVSLSAELISGGVDVSEYGVYAGPADNPYERKIIASNLSNSVFSVDVTGLLPETEYVLTLFASNPNGEGTLALEPVLTESVAKPVIGNIDLLSVFPNLFTVKGSLHDDGNDPSVECGIKWGLSESDLSNETSVESLDEDGAYTIVVENLSPETTIYVAGYAENAAGETLSQILNVTLPGTSVPEVETFVPAKGVDVFDNSVTLRGHLISDGGLEISEYGFVFNGEKYVASDLSDDKYFSVEITEGINPNTEYAATAYAVNSEGQSNEKIITVKTGLVDGRPDGELFVRDENMQQTTTRLVYWELEPVTVSLDLDGDGVDEMSRSLAFLDRNLGATSLPESFDSDQRVHPEAVGSYFQWGSSKIAPEISYMKALGGYTTKLSITQSVYTGALTVDKTWSALAEDPSTGVKNPCPDGYRPVSDVEMLAALEEKGTDYFYLSRTGHFLSGGKYDDQEANSQNSCYMWLDTPMEGTGQNAQVKALVVRPATAPSTSNKARKLFMPVRCVREITE